MAVKLMDNKDVWDKFIDESPYGTLFHKWDFLKIMEKHSNHTLYPYAIYRGDELVCLFPLFIRRYMGVNMVFSPPPNMAVPRLGFVMSAIYDKLKQRRKETYINDVIDEMEQELKKIKANFILISTVNGFKDVRPLKWSGYGVQMDYSYTIDLRRPLEGIWEDFGNSLKREIRNTEKLHLSIRPTDDHGEFYRIMQERYRQQKMNLPIASEKYLKDILVTFPDNVKANFIYNGDKVVDLIMYYQYKKHVVFWMGWVSLDKSIHSNEFMTWEYLKSKKAEGYETLEILGANVERLCLFKSKFNASLVYGFSATKKDLLGETAERVYKSFVKRKWF